MEDFIQVSARFRPIRGQEEEKLGEARWEYGSNHQSVCLSDNAVGKKEFVFDSVLGPSEDNEKVYEKVAKKVVSHVLDGFNGTVLAYGQTGSGKTFTIGNFGTDQTLGQSGLLQHAVQDLFGGISTTRDGRTYLVRISYLEVYNEKIYDLLADGNTMKRQGLKIIRDDPVLGVMVQGLQEIIVESSQEVEELLRQGEKVRHFRGTTMNERSSRSHTIFRAIVESTSAQDGEGGQNKVKVSCLSFVDLAGSERQSQAGTSGVSLKEGSNINKSLLALREVISGLTNSRKEGSFIPYRNSKLTRILRQSLGGNAVTHLICNVSPSVSHMQESMNTLHFGVMCKKVKNSAQRNEVGNDGALIDRYKKELDALKNELEQQREKNKNIQEQLVRKTEELNAFREEEGEDEEEKKDEDDPDMDVATKYALRAQRWWRKAELERLQALREQSAVNEEKARALEEKLASMQVQQLLAMPNTGEGDGLHRMEGSAPSASPRAGRSRRPSLTWVIKSKGAAERVLQFANAIKASSNASQESSQNDNRLLREQVLQLQSVSSSPPVTEDSLQAVQAWEKEMEAWYGRSLEYNQETEERARLVDQEIQRLESEKRKLAARVAKVVEAEEASDKREQLIEEEARTLAEELVESFDSKRRNLEKACKRFEEERAAFSERLEALATARAESIILEQNDSTLVELKTLESRLVHKQSSLKQQELDITRRQNQLEEQERDLVRRLADVEAREADVSEREHFCKNIISRESVLAATESRIRLEEKAFLENQKATEQVQVADKLRLELLKSRESALTALESRIGNALDHVTPTIQYARLKLEQISKDPRGSMPVHEMQAILSNIVDHFTWFNETVRQSTSTRDFLVSCQQAEKSSTDLKGFDFSARRDQAKFQKLMDSLAKSLSDILSVAVPIVVENKQIPTDQLRFQQRLLSRYLSEAKIILLSGLSTSE